MRTLLTLLTMCAALAWSADEPADGAAQASVLITAFKPFAQRQVNGSETIAEALRRDHGDGQQIKVVVLDVQWGEPAAKLPALVKQLRPRLLIGLGEGSPGAVMVERVARNHRVGRDERGAMPPERWVEAGGPRQRLATLEFDQAWQLSREIAVASSDDAGSYLCNALLYTALGLEVERVGFIHLPPQDTTEDAEYAKRFAPIVRELIKRNL